MTRRTLLSPAEEKIVCRLYRLPVEPRWSLNRLADAFGYAHAVCVARVLERHGIERQPRGWPTGRARKIERRAA
jgi:hypothetical protein